MDTKSLESVRDLPRKIFERVGQNPEHYQKFVSGMHDGVWYAQTPQGLWLTLLENINYVVLTLWGCEEAARHGREYPWFHLFAGTREMPGWDHGRASRYVESADFEIHRAYVQHPAVLKDVILILAIILELTEGNFDLSTFLQSEMLAKV